MKSNEKKYTRKVISLLIKLAILVLSLFFIYQKITFTSYTFNLSAFFSEANKITLLIVLLLMFVNWSLEALKWKLLIAPFEKISFLISLKSIFTGVTVSVFTPNRVGEFAGRIFFLNTADKIQATIVSMLGSLFQLIITVLAGIIAYFILKNEFQFNQLFSKTNLLITVFLLVTFLGFCLFIYLQRNTKLNKYKKYIDVFTNYSKSQIISILSFSLVRYLVFSTQYFLILNLFGIAADSLILFSLIALTFFVTTVIPTFALTEIVVRSATAVYFFTLVNTNSETIVFASLFLWIINLALPALIGSLFVWKLKFFKD